MPSLFELRVDAATRRTAGAGSASERAPAVDDDGAPLGADDVVPDDESRVEALPSATTRGLAVATSETTRFDALALDA